MMETVVSIDYITKENVSKAWAIKINMNASKKVSPWNVWVLSRRILQIYLMVIGW